MRKPSFPVQLIIIVLIMLISAALELFLIIKYYQTDDRYAGDNVAVFDQDNLALLAGEGEKTQNGLNVQRLGERGFALISSDRLRLRAGIFNEFEWSISGFHERTRLQFVWTTRRAPSQPHYIDLPYQVTGHGTLKLADLDQWQGFIAAIGLRVEGEPSEDFTIRQLKLKPQMPDTLQLLQRIWQEWTYFEAWNERSINFIVGSPRHGVLIRPVPATAAWLALNLVLYTSLWLISRRRLSRQPFIIFFIIGWLVLDMRWQWNLWRQNVLTLETFDGKTLQEKQLAEPDAGIFKFAQEVSKRLSGESARVFVISADPYESNRYTRLRLHYHLLPHNVYSTLSSLSDSIDARIHEGDYLVILNPVNGLQYFQEHRRLVASENEASLRASLLYSADEGYVFRIDS